MSCNWLFRLKADGVRLSVIDRVAVTSGAQKIFRAAFEFDECWDGLAKTAVFEAYSRGFNSESVSKEVVLDDTGECEIPWEVLAEPGKAVAAGVYGVKADGTRLPTVWCELNGLLTGVGSADEGTKPTPDVYQQIVGLMQSAESAAEAAQESAESAEAVAESVRKDADEGKFNGAPGEPGKPGAPGAPGGYYVPVVENGQLSFTPSEAGMPEAIGGNVQGPAGGYYKPVLNESTGDLSFQASEAGMPEATGGNIKGPPGQDGVHIDDTTVNTTDAWSSKKILDTLCPPLSVSGNPVVCYPVEGYPLSVNVEWTPTQEGTGDPSPDNVRAIVGRESVSVTASGKNLANVFNIDSEVSVTGNLLRRNEDGSIYVERNDPSNSAVTSGVTLRELCPGIVPGTYMLTAESTGVSKFIFASVTWKFGTAMTLNESALDALVYFYASQLENNSTALITNFQIELGSTPTQYEPHTGTTQTITLSSTIYGGSVGNDGEGEETWGHIASYNGETLPGEWISDRDVYADGTTPTIGAEVAYKLATPNPITITPFSIPALAGTNTVYTDADTVEVEGRADIARLLTQNAEAATYSEMAKAIREGVNQA